MRRLFRWTLVGRDITLRSGVGKGLKFNSSDYNPDTVLGIYELPIQEAMQKYLRSGDVFYDIGANVGFFSTIAGKLVNDSGQVYAFEPAPANLYAIKHNIQLNGFSNTEVLEKAVSQKSGKGELLLGNYSGSHTLSTTDKSSNHKKYHSRISVDIISIDDLIEQQAIKPPSVVKIDVEGAELDVIEGMCQTIQKFKPVLIYEIDDRKQDRLLLKEKEINKLIDSFGYKIEVLRDAYPEMTWHYAKHFVAFPI
ncbi:MAG: FkbM family methyltransferase [Okeania sp. SIO2D1]|nr:FkbM family methyltransferase [Okeania sp. SIO2D1]